MYPIGMCKTMALVACAMIALGLSNVAYASGNGGSSGSDSTSGSGGSGSSGSGSSGSGNSGSSNSSGKPDSSSDDGGDDDGGGSTDNSGSGSQGSTKNSRNSAGSRSGRVANQDEVLSAVKAGKAVSLPLLLAFMATAYPGEIVDIALKNKEGQYSYEIEYLANSAKLRVVKLNAKTLGKL